MTNEEQEVAAIWQRHGAYYHRDAMVLSEMISRRYPWNRENLAFEWVYMMGMAAQCYRQARRCMGLEPE